MLAMKKILSVSKQELQRRLGAGKKAKAAKTLANPKDNSGFFRSG